MAETKAQAIVRLSGELSEKLAQMAEVLPDTEVTNKDSKNFGKTQKVITPQLLNLFLAEYGLALKVNIFIASTDQ